VSALEISLKRALGKLRAPDQLAQRLREAGFAELGVTWEHGFAVGDLPLHHHDPFDRLLVAQARIEQLAIVTRDPQIPRYDVEVLAA
jgi:PIN domain nuclease of toxin-antitoxin system